MKHFRHTDLHTCLLRFPENYKLKKNQVFLEIYPASQIRRSRPGEHSAPDTGTSLPTPRFASASLASAPIPPGYSHSSLPSVPGVSGLSTQEEELETIQ